MCHHLDFGIFHKYVAEADTLVACLLPLCQGSSVTYHQDLVCCYIGHYMTVANLNTPCDLMTALWGMLIVTNSMLRLTHRHF